MVKVGILVLADKETHADLGRIANALEVAKEFQEGGDEVTVIFDGAGTRWIGELSRTDHRLHRQFSAVRANVAGACRYCAAAFGVTEEVQASGIPLLGEFEGHPSIRKLVLQDYQIITF
jgi:hypothetical protein